MLLKYLLCTTIGGGIVGAAHGAASLHLVSSKAPIDTAIHVTSHAQVGAIVGPWLPIMIPVWFVLDGSGNDTRCPIMKGGVYHRKRFEFTPTEEEEPTADLPTVAEKP